MGGNTRKNPMDLSGQKFGSLIIIKKSDKKYRNAFLWECRCDCGAICHVQTGSLKAGNVKSCGCKYRKHGMTDTLIYKVWQMMKDRCQNPNSKAFYRYGGRNIGICEEWRRSSASFINWAIENGYSKGLTIDRINNDGDYSPENCRFVTAKVNGRNSSQTKLGFDEVLEIKKLLVSNKLRSKEIAKRFCATLAMVSQIKRNVTWKDVPWPIGGINGEC